MIKLHTFGRLTLTGSEGHEISSVLAQPKRVAVLTYLALATPRGLHRRDTLLGLFWPDLDQEHARGALSQALSFMRRSLGDVIETRGDDEVGLRAEDFWCDALDFEASLDAGQLSEALELYQGDLLTGFFIDDAPEFEHWLDRERARLRRRAAVAAWALSDESEAEGNGPDAERWARRATALAPDDESNLRRLIALLDRVGDRAQAVVAYEAFAQHLMEEYELEPSPETRELIEGIRTRLEKVPANGFTDSQEDQVARGLAGALADPSGRRGDAIATVVETGAGPWKQFSLVLGALALVLGLGLSWSLLSTEPPLPVTQLRMGVQPAPILGGPAEIPSSIGPARGQTRTRTAMTVSPDGRRLVFSGQARATQDGPPPFSQLYVREFDQVEAVVLPGTEGAVGPIFSPDGQSVAFWSEGSLKKISLAGGLPVILTEMDAPFGASWGAANNIVFAPKPYGGLMQVSADGSANGDSPEVVTTPEEGEFSHRLPHFLPGAQAVLFTVRKRWLGSWLDAQIAVQSLVTGEKKILIENCADARYVPTGHLLCVRLGTLMAVPFDLERLEVTGGATVVLEGIFQSANAILSSSDIGAGQFSVSDSGTLVYLPGGIVPDRLQSLVWVDRQGATERLPLAPRVYRTPRISPDGQQVAVIVRAPNSGFQDVWVYDVSRETFTRVTEEGDNHSVAWMPDGNRVAFTSDRAGPGNVYSKRADGAGTVERLTTGEREEYTASLSAEALAVVVGDPESQTYDIWVGRYGADGAPEPFMQSPSLNIHPAFSPDGTWLAYTSNRSGRYEVHLARYPSEEGGLVSTGGGFEPVWSSDGQLYYRDLEGRTMVVEIAPGPTFNAGMPQVLFGNPGRLSPSFPVRSYDISPDGQRFIIILEEPFETPTWAQPPNWPPTYVNVVQNWFEELRRLVPD